MKPQSVVLILASVAAITVASLAPKALYVNGVKSAKMPIEQNGEVYIPASSLSAAGADVAITSSRVSVQFKPVRTKNEQAYVEGVLGEWVSNGSWRFRISNVQPLAENPFGVGGNGFALDFEARNTGKKPIQLAYSGVLGVQLLDQDENRASVTSSSFTNFMGDIQPGGGFKNTLKFGSQAGANMKDAAKLIIQFAPPSKSVRINLKPE
jgi:hypothetical protein